MESVMNTIIPNRDINSNVYNKDTILLRSKDTELQEIQSSVNVGTQKESSSRDNNNKSGMDQWSDKLFKNASNSSSRMRSEYTYHQDINRISIKVINEDTQEVIREIPPEKSLEVLKELMKIEGLFVDERRWRQYSLITN